MNPAPKYLEFVYLPEFERAAKGLFTDNDLREMENALAARPNAGAMVVGTGGMRSYAWPWKDAARVVAPA